MNVQPDTGKATGSNGGRPEGILHPLPTRKRWFALSAAVLVALAVFGAWGATAALRTREAFVDFSATEALDAPPLPAAGETDSLRVAVATMWSVESTFSRYDGIVRAIGNRVGRESSFLLRSSYRHLLRAMAEKRVDVAFACTGPYVESVESFKLLAQPVFRDGVEYHSAVIVRSQSDAQSLGDLEGRAMGFSDPHSFTGRLVPAIHLLESGRHPERFFQEIVYTGSHERSIQSVGAGIVDAAAVHSVVLASALAHDPALEERIRVIWRSPAYGPPPVVVPRDMEPRMETKLRRAFLELGDDAEGERILASLGIERFAPADTDAYRTAFELYERIRTHPESKTWLSNEDR